MDESNSLSEVEKLKSLLQSADLPANLHDKAAEQIERIYLTLKHGGNLSQLDITAKYIDWITNLPWDKKSEDVLGQLFAKGKSQFQLQDFIFTGQGAGLHNRA